MSESESDPLLAFAAEGGLPAADATVTTETAARVDTDHQPPPAVRSVAADTTAPPSGKRGGVAVRFPWPTWASAAMAIAAVAASAAWVYPRLIPVDAATPRPTKLTVVTRPAGADVLIDGESRGLSPVSLSLAAGAHEVTLRQGSIERVLPLTLTAGSEVTHHVELTPAAAAAAATAGGMSVVTDPPGAQVLINGRARGVSPLTLSDLASANYRVRVNGPTGSAERTVSVKAGTTAAVVFSLARVSSPLAGWIAVSAPFDVDISENSNVVGTGRTAKIMLPAGRHTLSLANDALQYSSERSIEVVAGQTATLRVDAPRAPISANARPWADVLVDGTSVGQTPIANLELPIGPHEVLFRHPQLGDRRQTLVVTSNGPNRISVDLTK